MLGSLRITSWAALKGRKRSGPRRGRRESLLRAVSVRVFAFAFLVLLLLLRVWDPLPVETLRLRTFDLYQILKPRSPGAQRVVIVDIDEKSLKSVGQWPWPRTVVADMTAKLIAAGAKAVGFDFVLAEPDRLSPENIIKSIRKLPAAAEIALRQLPSNDAILAQVIRNKPVVLGRAAIEKIVRPASGETPMTPIAILGNDPTPFLLKFAAVVENLPVIEKSAAGRGIFSLGVESDNIVRRVPAIYQVGGQIHPSMVTEMIRVGAGESTILVRSNAAGIVSVAVGRTVIPTDRNGRMWIHYAPRSATRFISAVDVLNGRVEKVSVAGKYVLIGTSAAGLRDLKATPIAQSMPGVEVQSQVLEMILSGKGLERPNYALAGELAVLLITGLLVIVLVPRLGAWWTLLLGGIVGMGLAGGAWLLYSERAVLIDVAYTSLASFTVFALLVFLNYVHGEAERRHITAAFSRYLSPELVARVADHRGNLKLGGEQREMTLLFSDVHGFTGISENYDAVGLTELINRLFNPLTHAVLDHGGTVDKYMGDSIMAFWNAPLDDPMHARNACRAALEMRRQMGLLNEEFRAEAEAEGRPFLPIKVGIGINTGDCCVGNMGSDLRFDYSVLGDTVNIASRIEGQTRIYKVPNVIGESTYRLAPELAFIELDRVTVLGKTVPVRIYTLVGDETIAATAAYAELRDAHAEMLAAYRGRHWEDSLVILKHCRTLADGFELAPMYDMYEARIAEFGQNPPEPDWDAVYVAGSKS